MQHLEKILDFIQHHLKYKDRELLRQYVLEHEKYRTIDYAFDTNENIVALVRWNMSSDGKVGEILDLAIDKKYRNKGVGRDFILRALRRFDKAKVLKFQRGTRGDSRFKELNIEGILKRKIL